MLITYLLSLSTAVYREESCIRKDFNLFDFFDVTQAGIALSCPLVVEGYSIYPSQDETTGPPLRYRLDNVLYQGVIVYFMPISTAQELFEKHSLNETNPFTYPDLVAMAAAKTDGVTRGIATDYTEILSAPTATELQSNDTTIYQYLMRGVLDDGRTFDVRIEGGPGLEEEKRNFKVAAMEPAKDDDSDDGYDWEADAFVGGILGAGVLGAICGIAATVAVKRLGADDQTNERQSSARGNVPPKNDEVPEETHNTDYA